MEFSPQPPPSRPEAVHVRAADGSLEPYDPLRVRSGVERAQARVEDDDPWFAAEVESVVRLALAARHAGCGPSRRVWDVDEIEELVEEALIEMGRAKVARAYIVDHDRRSRARAALRVVIDPARGHALRPGPARTWVEAPDGVGEGWNPPRLVASLLRETELPRELAEQVAARVEERILGAGWRRITSTFVRELVGNELASMGFDAARRRQSPLTISRHDVLGRLSERGRGPAALEASLAGDLLASLAREEVLPEGPRRAHLEGEIHVAGLSRPQLPMARAVPLRLLVGGLGGAGSAVRSLDRVGRSLEDTGRLLVLEECGPLCSRLLGPRGRRVGPLGDWLRALGVVARAAGRALDLGPPGPMKPLALASLLGELAEARAQGEPVPRLCLGWAELEPALSVDHRARGAAERLLAEGGLIAVHHGAARRWIGPGMWRRADDRRPRGPQVLAGAVALPLPRLARRAGPWREEALMSSAVDVLRTAIDAIVALDAFQRGLRGARGIAAREERRFALVPVGLGEALRILADGRADPALGARLLGFLFEAAEREGRARGLRLGLTSFFGEGAARRFARLDAQARRASQSRLFQDLPTPEDELVAAYGCGLTCSQDSLDGTPSQAGPAAAGRVLARELAGLPCAALWPFPGARPSSRSAAGLPPGLSLWSAFWSASRDAARAPDTAPFLAEARLPRPSAGPLFDLRPAGDA